MKKLFLLLLFIPFVFAVDTPEYSIDVESMHGEIELENVFSKEITVSNKLSDDVAFEVDIIGNISKLGVVDTARFILGGNENKTIKFNVFGEEETTNNEQDLIKYPRLYEGAVEFSGDIREEIPVSVMIHRQGTTQSGSLVVDLKPISGTVIVGKTLRYIVDLKNIYQRRNFDVVLTHSLVKINHPINRSQIFKFNDALVNKTINLTEDNLTIIHSFSIPKDFAIDKDFEPGEYILLVQADYLNLHSESASYIDFKLPFLKRKILKVIPIWVALLVLALGILGYTAYKIIKHQLDKRRRFKVQIDYKELPKEGPRSLFVGMIAETKKRAYFDMDILTVHSIVAGSTGGGKSIAAQDIVEETLIKGAAIVVFDPTAQWSGMLRKCVDKKMLSFYGNMGMKTKEARAFPGNIRAVNDGREMIDIYKYWKAGEIQVFTTSRLEPKDYDLFVANTIRQIFRSNLQEYRGLRYMLVYDEIHRILPKFGGSGQGFIQIERGCREFRKWGIGILLISQVLQDFVGQIKANINTNVQMKTRDEGDLGRIKQNYGEEFIQALIKAPVGSGMVQNSAWNRGRPYYITFRPILHSVVRLSDEELDKYNKYNDIVDDLEYQFEQLEGEGQDVFDLKLELKLSKDKIKSGNFNMVQIYLDGLTPRIEKLWNKLGKKPKKLEKQLVDVEEMEKEIEQAKQEHDEAAEKAKEQEQKDKEKAKKEEAEKEEEIDEELAKANLESIGQLATQVRDLIPHKDWNTINDLIMEITSVPLPKKDVPKKEKTIQELKTEIETAKNPPKEEEGADEKKDDPSEKS